MTKKSPPKAGSVDRDPSNEPTPKGEAQVVSAEDEPKGHPTSDRFRTESAQSKKK